MSVQDAKKLAMNKMLMNMRKADDLGRVAARYRLDLRQIENFGSVDDLKIELIKDGGGLC